MGYTYTHSHCCCGHGDGWSGHHSHHGVHEMPHVHPPYMPAMPMKYLMPFVEPLDATASRELLVGGEDVAHLTVEYMKVDAAADSKISVEIITPGSSPATWSEGTPVGDGYHVKTDFAPVQPGSLVKVVTQNVVARLRWCESFHCS